LRIVHLAAEVSPFAKTGGLGDVVGALPKFQADRGDEVSVWMPLYRKVREELDRRGIRPQWVMDPFRVEVGFHSYEVGIVKTTLPGSEVPVYFVGHDPFFDRPEIYAPGFGGKDDGLLRYAVFVRAALAAIRRLGPAPDVLHCHDWHTSLAPMALAWDRPRDWIFERTVSVMTIHNVAYQGVYAREEMIHLGIPADSWPGLDFNGDLNLLKGAVVAADGLTTVSPRFAWEMTTAEGGFGLHPILSARSADLVGIVNGIDGHVWNPAVDPKIPENYSLDDLERKRDNRRALLALTGMDRDDPGLVVGLVGRLTNQKGIDLLFPVLGDLIGRGIRFVALGSGESELENRFHAVSNRATGRFWGYVGFNDELAHLIEAGADTFLMPSRFEPCGLNQLYSLAYGTPPIVRNVGGLADTVVGFDGSNLDRATGFAFDQASPMALWGSVRLAQACYHEPDVWTRIVRNAMAQDFHWERAAQRYEELYRGLRRRRGLE